jgi:hypothetical protein
MRKRPRPHGRLPLPAAAGASYGLNLLRGANGSIPKMQRECISRRPNGGLRRLRTIAMTQALRCWRKLVRCCTLAEKARRSIGICRNCC